MFEHWVKGRGQLIENYERQRVGFTEVHDGCEEETTLNKRKVTTTTGMDDASLTCEYTNGKSCETAIVPHAENRVTWNDVIYAVGDMKSLRGVR